MINKEINNEQVSLYTPLSKFRHCFSTRTYTRLGIGGIETLGDLLSKSKEDLLSIKSFGQTSLAEVETFLKQMGYSLRKTKTLEKENQNASLGNNVIEPSNTNVPLEEFKNILSARAYNLLRRENINTIDALIKKPIIEISNIHNMGNVTLNEIINFVHSLGLIFNGEEEMQEDEIEVLETKIKEERKSQTEITSRIALKEKLLKKYNCLIEAKKNLLKQEQELDEQIRQALETLKTLKPQEEQKVK